MKYIISGTDIKQADKYTIDKIGIPSLVLMERAALAVAEKVITIANTDDKISVICGVGNNGADGVAVARILCNRGFSTCIYILGDENKGSEEFKSQLAIYRNCGYSEASINNIEDADIVVDAIFGVGLSREISGVYNEIINNVNVMNATVISVDVPSGINADNGQVMGIAVKADYTVTFGMHKLGVVLYPGVDYAGEISVVDIGLSPKSFSQLFCIKSMEEVDYKIIPKRRDDSNKGTYGKLLVIAGSDDMQGAAYLSAKAALRMGVGMVKVFTTENNKTYINQVLPEAMVTTYNNEDVINSLAEELEWCDNILVGPGLGRSKTSKDIVDIVLRSSKVCLLDADAINIISENEELKQLLHKDVVMTPHVGEMSRFIKNSISGIKQDFLCCAMLWAKEYGITIVLKDARTVITDGKDAYINMTGNNGMSTAGSGDVLAGIISGLMAKKMNNIEAAAMGAFIHGLAGDNGAKRLSKTSLVATDIIDELIAITKNIEED